MASYKIQPAYLMFALLFTLSAVSADLFTKTIIVELVMQPPRVIPVTSFFNLVLSYNEGVSFGLFADLFRNRPGILTFGTSLIVLIIIGWAAVAKNRTEAAALGLISGGASGNIVDRAKNGAVTDFLDFYIADWHWPAFNLADVAIVGGTIILVGASLLSASPSGIRAD
ncbi:signal peptidase II [Mesorhizobium sp. STM 4661]|uniref:signal peptidase II n=1 Tax=Mesorhizobium sp. STM 4661 TaxID=1297570 RepID=UPI0002BE9B41|nr:signal peptidase II [Mesorhizobium sp. STM 4661]CCV11921.1 Signal peptidase II. Aspartic peptidase. MEROPS family A08 [Mesorhizobium sp. STM 4661]